MPLHERTTVHDTLVHVHDGHPAVNVKVYDFGDANLIEAIQSAHGCDAGTAQRVANIAWESACEDFWHSYAEDRGYADIHFSGLAIEIYSAGRSGGWLEVHGLPEPVEDWPAELVAQWAAFERDVLADVAYRCEQSTILEDIDANGWAIPFTPCPTCGHPYQAAQS